MSHKYSKLFQRALTPSEKLYIGADANNYSFFLQLVLEMDSEVDIPSLKQAIIQVNTLNPYVNLRANLNSYNSFWYKDSENRNDSNLIHIEETEWDGDDIQSPSFFHSHQFHSEESATQITYIKGSRHFLVFRAFHGIMDGMGLYLWVNTIFHAWHKQNVVDTYDSLTDYEFLKQIKCKRYRPNFSFDCIAPLGHTGKEHAHHLWHKVTLPGKINAITAKLCDILFAYSVERGGTKGRFMIPVDLRTHTPEKNITANFSNPIFVEVREGTSWQLIYSDMIQQLSKQNELILGKYDSYLHYMPLPLLKLLINALISYQNKKRKYMMTGLISKLSIELEDLNLNHHQNRVIDGYFLPINVPLSPIALVVTEHENATTICFSISNAHATEADCNHLAKQFKKLLGAHYSLDRDKKHSYCNSLWPIYNNTTVDYPKDRTIFSKIWECTQLHKQEHVLISDNSVALTYEELRNRVIEIASFFHDLGVTKGDKVALFLPRNKNMVCSILACWYLGAAYIPIDIKSPLTWVLSLLEDAKPVLFIHDQSSEFKINWLGLSTQIPKHVEVTKIPEVSANSLNELAYIIYTSGSTGTPKGVMINHDQLLNYLSWAVIVYRNDDQPYHTALFTSIAFDLTVTTLFLPLLTGGSIQLTPDPITSLSLKKMMLDESINFMKLTPSHLRMVLNFPMHRDKQITLVVGGESFPCQLAQSIMQKLPGAQIFNEYGPTETTVGCMIHQFDKYQDIDGSVPIGIPAANTRIYCLDEHRKPVKIGQEGEIFIAGSNVGLGYLNKPEATVDSFINDPYVAGQRMYQSGDLAKHREDGLLVYLGRKDQQAKVRGHRIELSMIENKLAEIDGILQVIVLSTKMNNTLGEAYDVLVAYMVSNQHYKSSELRNLLSKALPYYMLPNHYIFLNELPMTINGKIDQKQLPKPIFITSIEVSDTDDLLTHIRQLFARALLLPLEEIDIHATFDEMGGDSIQMAYVLHQMMTKMVAPKYLAAFSDQFEHLLACATPQHFYDQLVKFKK
ncbi:non-ribosomal peptide synthetase [Legionella santicrucis]|uniref:Non-ribosomal peptide synthetase n=1 Tax=Legionella santicrucis TaxID=45074 RepID=A0A0W0Y9V4_9GAMM|nr:non-ribosomal peptide synthetase [Legionella santicrucis]KTD53720.1 non-ribosomal peptide synthetase [Legionella santicrucis]